METYTGKLYIYYRNQVREIPYSLSILYRTPMIVIDDKEGYSYHFDLVNGQWVESGGLTQKIPDDMKAKLYDQFHVLLWRHVKKITPCLSKGSALKMRLQPNSQCQDTKKCWIISMFGINFLLSVSLWI